MKKGINPLQLPKGKEDSLVTSPFSTFGLFLGESFSCGGRSNRMGIVGQAGALVEREPCGGGENWKKGSKLFLDGIFQTGLQSENKCAF